MAATFHCTRTAQSLDNEMAACGRAEVRFQNLRVRFVIEKGRGCFFIDDTNNVFAMYGRQDYNFSQTEFTITTERYVCSAIQRDFGEAVFTVTDKYNKVPAPATCQTYGAANKPLDQNRRRKVLLLC